MRVQVCCRDADSARHLRALLCYAQIALRQQLRQVLNIPFTAL